MKFIGSYVSLIDYSKIFKINLLTKLYDKFMDGIKLYRVRKIILINSVKLSRDYFYEIIEEFKKINK